MLQYVTVVGFKTGRGIPSLAFYLWAEKAAQL